MKICSNCDTTNKDIANFCSTCGLPLPGAAALNRLQVGQALNSRYTVARPLSKGGMGAIYLVQNGSIFGKQRVLKEMLDYVAPAGYPDRAAYQQAVQRAHWRFKEETRTLASLKHRGIPAIMDYFSGGCNYIGATREPDWPWNRYLRVLRGGSWGASRTTFGRPPATGSRRAAAPSTLASVAPARPDAWAAGFWLSIARGRRRLSFGHHTKDWFSHPEYV